MTKTEYDWIQGVTRPPGPYTRESKWSEGPYRVKDEEL